jgi:exonuclease III
MNPKIITLNMRGTNEVKKRMQIRGLLREWKADIVYLQEMNFFFFF